MAPTARSLGAARLSLLNKPRELTTREEFAADIRREWTNALEATVAVGRRLIEAKAKLPHGEYQAMVERDLPFTAATARKLREVAEFVDAGKVPIEKLPEAYSTLYTIATLPEETRQQALEQGVIRPDMKRSDLEEFKRLAAAPAALPSPDEPGLFDSLAKEAEPAAAPAGPVQGAPVPVPPAPPRPTPPPVIDVQAVEVEEPAGDAPAGVNYLDALYQPWQRDPADQGAIRVELNGTFRTLVVMVPHGPDVPAIVQHIVNLHNESLRGE